MLHFGWDLVQWIWLKCWPLWLHNTLHLHTHIYTLAFSFFGIKTESHEHLCSNYETLDLISRLLWYFTVFSFTLAFRYLCKLMCTLWWMQLHTQKKTGGFTTDFHLGVSWTVNVFFFSYLQCYLLPLHTFSFDSGTRQETLPCLSRNSWNCWSLMMNLSASLRAFSPAFSPSINRHWNTWTQEARTG